MSDAGKTDMVTVAVDKFIMIFGESLKKKGALDNFDPNIKDAILERLNQNPE